MRLSIACFHLPVFKGSTGPWTVGPGVERAHGCFLRTGGSTGHMGTEARAGLSGAQGGVICIMPGKDSSMEGEVGLHHLPTPSGGLRFSEVLTGVGDCQVCLSQEPSEGLRLGCPWSYIS